MFKQRRHKIFSALTVVCLSLTSPLFLTRNSWAQQSSETETASLRKQLKNQDVQQRLDAIDDLNKNFKSGKAKPEVFASNLITALKDPNRHVREKAVDALANKNVPAKLSVPALIGALKDPNKDVRQATVISLGWIGAPAQSAIPALIALLKHSNKDMRYEAATALGQIVGAPYGGALPDVDIQMRESATNALLNALDKDPDVFVHLATASSLQNMGAFPQGLWLGSNSIGCSTSYEKITTHISP